MADNKELNDKLASNKSLTQNGYMPFPNLKDSSIHDPRHAADNVNQVVHPAYERNTFLKAVAKNERRSSSVPDLNSVNHGEHDRPSYVQNEDSVSESYGLGFDGTRSQSVDSLTSTNTAYSADDPHPGRKQKRNRSEFYLDRACNLCLSVLLNHGILRNMNHLDM